MMRYRNIISTEMKMIGGLKTLIIKWDDGDIQTIWGSCLDKVKDTLK